MKITIVGPGAIGCLFAGFLARANEEVWLLDKNPQRAGRLKEEGIKIEGLSNISVKMNATINPDEIGQTDLIIICVKSYDTEQAIRSVKQLVGEKTAVMTLQNGIGNTQIIGEIVGRDRVIGGVTNHGATLLGWGHIRHAGKGETIIGKTDGKASGQLEDISAILNKAGFETVISKDIDAVIWSKLIINVGINALTALTRLNNGRLIEYEGTKDIMRLAVFEAVKIAKVKRIKLIYDDPIEKIESVCKATAGNVSSMLQDVLNKKRTEIDFINGAVVKWSQSLNVPTPVNYTLTNLIKTVEASYELQVVKK